MLATIVPTAAELSRFALALLAALSLASAGTTASAQGVETFDPDEVFAAAEPTPQAAGPVASGGIDADLVDPNAAQSPDAPQIAPPTNTPTYTMPQPVPANGSEPGFDGVFDPYSDYGEAASAAQADGTPEIAAGEAVPQIPAAPAQSEGTYGEDDLIGAAEGVFGKGAEGLAKMIQDLLKDQGQPNGYIVGREAGGAFVFGARYGSGTLHHKIEGTRKVYWTGPSVGFDAGANAANTFVLVYNLYDTQDLFKRYAAGEGQAYLVGGLHASYVRRGDVVLIPIRMGVGARLGVNAGYLKFSEKQRWLPF